MEIQWKVTEKAVEKSAEGQRKGSEKSVEGQRKGGASHRPSR